MNRSRPAKQRKQIDPETLRRLQFGDLKTLLRARYGYELPADDAGMESLLDLLMLISADPHHAKDKMLNAVEIWAPWCESKEAYDVIGCIERMPLRHRRLSNRTLGQRQNVTNAERERLKIWRFAPVDMTAEQMAEHRKAKHRGRQRQQRLKAGSKSRAEYQANSISRKKPWQRRKISRATYYRQKAKANGRAHVMSTIQ
jgi:hypothetical protein